MQFKKLIFVSGKGGVGKSTISLCLARKLQMQGRRVLLVELGQRSSIQALASIDEAPGYKPMETSWGFSWSLLNGLDCLADYVGAYVKVEKVSRYFFDNPLMKNLVNIAPGLEDLAILGKLTSQIRNHGPSYDFDHIIVDAHSTGSFTSMLRAPRSLAKVVSSGPLSTQSQEIDQVLFSGKECQFIFVSLYEKFPVDELLQSTKNFSQEFTNKFSVIMNKTLPDLKPNKDDLWSSFLKSKLEQQELLNKKIIENFEQFEKKEIMTQGMNEHLSTLEEL